jgi:purine nucleoside phosphorylase
MAVKIGIIGGSGLGAPEILQERAEKSVKTPFGEVDNPTLVEVAI